jgi:predicted MFS family arabinose efflux permease
MKKTIFSFITALLLFILTMTIFYLPNDVIYEIKQPASELKGWANIWGFIIVTIMGSSTFHCYLYLAEKLFDYLKKD